MIKKTWISAAIPLQLSDLERDYYLGGLLDSCGGLPGVWGALDL